LKEEKGRRTDCLNCHTKEASLVSSRTAHKPIRDKKCMWCHKPHGNANINLLHEGGGRNLCVICHQDFKKVEGEKESHLFSNSKECLSCHDPHDSGKKFLLIKEGDSLCISCHKEYKLQKRRKVPT